LVSFDLVWFGLVWFGLVWFGWFWFGLVWFGLVCLLLLIAHLTGRYCAMMGIGREVFDSYVQAVLNIIPIMSTQHFHEEFFDEVMHSLRETHLAPHNFLAAIQRNSIG
jgi:hypothetical protein